MSLRPRKGSHLVMVLPDLHLPHHDRQALRVVLRAHALLKPRKTIILGDWLDCEAFSRHPVTSRAQARAGTFYAQEIEPCRRILSRLEENTEEIIYLEGNHEFRVERLVAERGGIWHDLADLVSPQRLLSEGRAKPFTWVPYVPQVGGLPFYKVAADLIATHGWTFCRHAAAKHLQMARRWSVVFGHIHRKQEHVSRCPVTGQVYRAWSPGCLSKLQPLYMAHNPTEWVHGFSLVWVRNDGERWTAYSPTIDRGECMLPDGTKVVGGKPGTPLDEGRLAA